MQAHECQRVRREPLDRSGRLRPKGRDECSELPQRIPEARGSARPRPCGIRVTWIRDPESQRIPALLGKFWVTSHVFRVTEPEAQDNPPKVEMPGGPAAALAG